MKMEKIRAKKSFPIIASNHCGIDSVWIILGFFSHFSPKESDREINAKKTKKE